MKNIVTSNLLNSKNTLYIEWEVTQKCNYRCSYCSAYDILGKNEIPWNKKKYILDELNKSKYNILLYLLGGEPTISKDYFKILDYIDFLNKKNNYQKFKCYISTNFSQNEVFYKNHPSYKTELIHWLSLHPEYLNLNEIENKINILLQKDIKFIFAPMIKKEFIDSAKKLYNLAKKYNLDYYPQIIVIEKDGHYWASDEKFYKKNLFLFENEKLEIKENNIFIPYHQYFLNIELQNKKNYDCWNSYFEIYWDGSITSRCRNINYKFLPINFFKEFKITKLKCNRDFCDDYTLIHMYKKET